MEPINCPEDGVCGIYCDISDELCIDKCNINHLKFHKGT